MQVFKPAFCFPITTQQIYLVQPQVRLQFRLKVLSSLNRCEVIIQTMLSERLIIFFIHTAGGIAVLIGKKFDCLIKNTTMDPPRRFVL